MKTMEQKRLEAEVRQAEHDKLTTVEKLRKAQGKKERAKLQKRLEKEQADAQKKGKA